MKTQRRIYILQAILLTLLILSAQTGFAQTKTNNTVGATTSSYSGATNIVVDFGNTGLDSELRAGDTGILTLVIKNIGGQPAKNVEVYLPTVGSVNIDKRFTLGTMASGDSKTMYAPIRVNKDAAVGLHIIQARVSYDGYTAEGLAKENQLSTLEIPVRIYGNPAFQITLNETTYYLDSIDELILEVSVKDAVKNLAATLTSDGFTVIGSSQKQLGDMNANQKTSLSYRIKPTKTGSCDAKIVFSYNDAAGGSRTETVSFGLNIQDAGVDFKILNISYDPTGPGEKVSVKTTIKNVGRQTAEDVTLTMELSDPFTTADTAEKYVGTVAGGETIEETFNLAISWSAATAVYSLPLKITYKVGGTTYSVKKDVGIDVGGQVILEVIDVSATGNTIKIDVANIGTRTADSVKATLIVGEGAVTTGSTPSSTSQNEVRGGPAGNPLSMLTGGNRRQTNTQNTETQNINQGMQKTAVNRTGNNTIAAQYVAYKSDIKATKQTTFTFNTMFSGTATLLLEYNGANNKRITQRIPITVGNPSSFSLSSKTLSGRGGGTDTTTYLLYGAGAVILLFIGYKVYRKHKNK